MGMWSSHVRGVLLSFSWAVAVTSFSLSTTSSPPGLARKEGVRDWCGCGTGLVWVDVWPIYSNVASGNKSETVRITTNGSAHWVQWQERTRQIGWLCSGTATPGSTWLSSEEAWWSLESYTHARGSLFCSQNTAHLRVASWATASYPTSIPYTSWEHDYYCVKVPSLLLTARGKLLAFGEARHGSCSDFTWTDVVLKTSLDGGRTWSELRVIRSESGPGLPPTVIGNVAPVQLPSGRILLPHTRNNSDVWTMHSDDEGVSWSRPRLLPNVTKPEWKWVGLGPPAGLLLSSGRVLIPAYHGTHRKNLDEGVKQGHFMISDDGGETWRLGAEAFGTNTGSNECQAVQLKNGSVLVNSRSNSLLSTQERSQTLSHDGGLSVGPTRYVPELPEPISGCEGSLVRGPKGDELFFSGPYSRFLRTSLTVSRSTDEGQSWQHFTLLDPGTAGYSSMQVLSSTSIGILYEQSDETQLVMEPDRFVFRVFNTSSGMVEDAFIL